MRKQYSFLAGVLCALCFAATSANATLIVGQLGFSGEFSPVGGLLTLGTATGIDITPGTAHTLGGNGDLFSFANQPASAVFYDNFDFSPPSLPNPLWTVTVGSQVLSFRLDTVNVVLQIDSPIQLLSLAGTGVLSLAGFDDTPARWAFTGNNAGGSFSYFSNDVFAPEPGSFICFAGLGFCGLACFVWRRRRKV